MHLSEWAIEGKGEMKGLVAFDGIPRNRERV